MGLAIDTVAFSATNPGAGPAAVAAATGDSLIVKSADMQNPIWLENLVRLGATAGFLQVRSPRMHDFAHGIRVRSLASSSRPLLGPAPQQRLYPSDQLTVEISGGAAEVDGGAMILYYTSLDGVAASLQTWDAISPRIVNLVGNEVACVTSGTAFAWTDTALNATFDVLKADAKYAVLGYLTDTEVNAVGIKGADTGNLRVGGPGTSERVYTEEWYIDNARESGRPWIPVISGTNKATTFVSVSHSALAATVNVSLILAELSG